MSTSPTGEHHNGAAAGEPLEDKMHQIRELLFGETKRENDARLAALEARVREFEQSMHRRLEALQASIDTLAREVGNERKRSLEQLASSIGELGDKVRRISAD